MSSLLIALIAFTSSPAPGELPLFVAGQAGYHNYRIPSLIVTKKGTVLAFAEGRAAMSDTGNVDLVMRRSGDGGKTWGALQVVAEDGANTVGNPCPVVDAKTGTIWLLLNWNLGADDLGPIITQKSKDTRHIWVVRSDDEGVTWSKPRDITQDVKAADWTWHATGPGCGIQLRTGRLVIPCDHITTKMEWGAHVIYSDDSGKTWQRGGVAAPGVNECQMVELADGTLQLNMRNAETVDRSKPHYRLISTSKDGGATWSSPQPDRTLVEPICQAALVRYGDPKRDLLLFSNPASGKRERMTIRLSEDGGRSWPHARVLHAGPAAYSALAVAGGEILCLYECGSRQPYETITVARFPLEWVMQASTTAGSVAH